MLTELPRSRGASAYDLLREAILMGVLRPNERLRAAELQGRYGLGLTPIREALVRLSSEGLVLAETHRGSRVANASAEALADIMAARREIERLCLSRAIAEGDAAWEAEIVAALHRLSRAPLPDGTGDRETARAWEVLHRGFHQALVAACGSEWLLRFWNTLVDHTELYRAVRLLNRRDSLADVRDIHAEHRAIAEAVIARDAARATALMDAHLKGTEAAMRRFLARSDEQAGPAPSPQGPNP